MACLLDEDLPKPRLPKGVVLQVEAVKAVEGVLVGMHVQRVHVQVIPAFEDTRLTHPQTLPTVHIQHVHTQLIPALRAPLPTCPHTLPTV